jgi:hypothetical protein
VWLQYNVLGYVHVYNIQVKIQMILCKNLFQGVSRRGWWEFCVFIIQNV